MFPAVKPGPSMGPPSFPHDQYDMNSGFDEDEALEQATMDSSSMVADEDMMPMSQHGSYSRKRRRGMNEAPAMSITEQEHILYGDQLLDYFMTVGDAPEATRIVPPVPPASFQVDRAIDDSGNTALHWACAMGDLDIVKDLIRRSADVKALSMHEETPLVRAVLFTNNYEKRAFSALLDLLLDTVSFRDWFGATIFHHLAETTRSKGKWKSSRYYCEALLEKLRNTCTQDEIDLLLSCQDSNGDSAALVAARNGAFRLVDMLLMHCPRAGELVNKKGETATSITQRAHHPVREIPPPPSSVIMGNDHAEGEGSAHANFDSQFAAHPPNTSPTMSALLSRIGTIMAEANKKLSVGYGSNKGNRPDSEDATNPEALYEQLELDRQKIQRQCAALAARENAQGPDNAQFGRYNQLRSHYESILEQIQQARLGERLRTTARPESRTEPMSQSELLRKYQLSQQLCSAQRTRRTAVKDLAQQTADAGVSTKFDVHRKLVALATGLKEEELDPMAAELAETLEFERMNGKGPIAESPEPEHRRLPPRTGSGQLGFPGPTVPVDV